VSADEQLGRFGRYSLIEHLAKGGMAQIYKAATPNGKVFTLKKILSDYSANPDFIKMFLEEAKISLNLKHPHIVRVLDFGHVEGAYFLAMEYVFGKDVGSLLRASVEKRVFIPIEVACTIIWQCARGLEYAHSLVDNFGKPSGIIHRDISPPNILISFNGDSKILDFGIAKATRSSCRQNTRSGVLKGKFSYMSPEQASGQPLGPLSDLFSLGIVFYELLTSRSLFFSQDEMETLERVRKGEVPKPSQHRKDLPDVLERIVMKALERKEKNRFESSGEFAEAIRSFLKTTYPRSDSRSVAKFLRACFPEDFKRRAKISKSEGWVDVLISGASDEDLLIDRSFSDHENKTPHAISRHRIGFLQRILYDPRTSKKVWAATLKVALLVTLAFGSFWIYQNPPREAWEFVVNRMHANPPTEQKIQPEEISEANLKQGGFAYWISEATKAEAEGRFDDYKTALERAKEINPLDSNIQSKWQFFRISQGDFVEACASLKGMTGLSAEDQALSSAICAEARGDLALALQSYSEFSQKFPSDYRADRVKRVVAYLQESIGPREPF